MKDKSKKGFFDTLKDVCDKKKSFWLFSKNAKQYFGKQKAWYFVFNILLVFVALSALSVCSLYLARGSVYPVGVFFGYFKSASIMILNFLPPLFIFMLLYALTGRGWISYLIDSILVMGLTIVNYFVIQFRDDPVMFLDIMLAREGAQISKEGYNYEITPEIIWCVVIPLVFTIVLFLFQKYVPSIKARLVFATIVVICVFSLKGVYFSTSIYDKKTDNLEYINRWSPTQKFVSKGYMYPFFHSLDDVFEAPEGYDEDAAKQILSGYNDKTSEDAKIKDKVNVIGVMLEAYCDIGNMNVEGISDEAYEIYRGLKEENYHGTLVTNIFAAGTIDSERAFLTGYPGMNNFRRDSNSYVRYLSSLGYKVVGSHPSENWFYNRKNVNNYLGFSEYRFIENYFGQKYDASYMRNDAVVFDDIYNQYVETSNDGKDPYFGFHITYQGHAPYPDDHRIWMTDENPLYHNENISEESENIVNNYLGSLYNTAQNLEGLVEKIKLRPEPVVLVFFGDHKPWLGDGNSVYEELGISLDHSNEEGFMNYYSTEYIIIANDAAKKVLGDDFKGEGPVISPCFLMNVVFDKIGIEGPAYMQYSGEIMKKLPALNDVGVIDANGNFYTVDNMPEDVKSTYDEFLTTAYYSYTNYDG